MGYNIIVYLLAIGAAFLLLSPTEGTYARRYEDRYERNPLFLEFSRETAELTTPGYGWDGRPNGPPNRNGPEDDLKRSSDPWKVPELKDKKYRDKKQGPVVSDEPDRDEDSQRRPLYLPIAVIMGKTKK